ncbi:MAG TPA: cell division FtsA domain-containing protein, partial [Verrucomicrobiae bacterium]|nr:cell division FtsA domain-containing protein [Verrucomicrobiae bacterium]
AIGLRTDIDIAEQVKVKHATLRPDTKKATVTVKTGSKVHNFEFEQVALVVEARVEELLEYVDKELQKIKRSRKLPGGVVLTGGTSKLPGIADFTRDKLQLPARIGKLQGVGGLVDTVEDQTFVTVVGLMLLDMLLLPSLPPTYSGKATQSTKALLTNVLGRFKR